MGMNWKEACTVPNCLSIFRLLSIPPLWIFALLRMEHFFTILFIAAGLTDFLDGFMARLLHQSSPFGAWLDSIADNIFAASIPFWLWIFMRAFLQEHFLVVLILFTLFIFTLLICYIKFHDMIHFHLYSNKVAAVATFFFITHALLFSPSALFLYITAILLVISITEELILILISDTIDPARVSLFKKSQ